VSDLASLAVGFGALAGLIGKFMIGRELGGVKSRTGRLAVVLGFAIFGVSALSRVLTFSTAFPPGVEPQQLLAALPGFVLGPTIYLGWAYLLGASADARKKWLAAGSAVILALITLELLITILNPFGANTHFGVALFLTGSVHLLAWSALIVGALRELPRRSASNPAGDPADRT